MGISKNVPDKRLIRYREHIIKKDRLLASIYKISQLILLRRGLRQKSSAKALKALTILIGPPIICMQHKQTDY